MPQTTREIPMQKDMIQIFRMIITQSAPILSKTVLDKRCCGTSHVFNLTNSPTPTTKKTTELFRNWNLPDRFGIGKGREIVATERRSGRYIYKKIPEKPNTQVLLSSSPSRHLPTQ